MSLQQEISMQNATLLNLLESVTRDVMSQSHTEIATLHRVLQRTQEDLEITRDVMNHSYAEIATLGRVLQRTQEDLETAYEINGSLIFMLAARQLETNSHVSSNDLEDEASSVARTAEETTKCDLICKVCNSGGACMLLLPCHHLCACKPCGDHLVACPICDAVKDEAIQLARLG